MVNRQARLPLLALDVDGPIALMGKNDSEDIVEAWVSTVPIAYSRKLPARIATLSKHFQIVWASAWGKRASLKIAPLLGLPPGLPFVPFDKFSRSKPGESYKLSGLKAFLKDAPAAIVDDEIGDDMRAWAETRIGTLLVQIDPRFGIQDSHVDQLVEFAENMHLI